MQNILNFNGFINEAETQDSAHLLFNGNKLDFIENGRVVKSWKACSAEATINGTLSLIHGKEDITCHL